MELLNSSARIQLVILSIIGLCGPGMMFALVCLGNGAYSPSNADLKTAVDISLMTSFLVSGAFSFLGCNISYRIGPRWCMFVSCVLYAVYTMSFAYNAFAKHSRLNVYTQVAAVLMGAGAGIFWSVQTTIIIMYPGEETRGRCMAMFAALFNMGGVMGGIIQFSLNANSKSRGVSGFTFVALAAVQVLGAIVSLALVSPTQVRREDTTLVMAHSAKSALGEMKRLGQHLYSKWSLLLVIPYFASHVGFAYTSDILCGALFNARSRGFNNIFFWLAKTCGSIVLGFLLDYSQWSRRRRAVIALAVLFLASNGCWLGAWADQRRLFVGGTTDVIKVGMLDYTQAAMAGPTIGLYTCFGFLVSVFDTLLMWLISLLSDDFDVTGRNVSVFRGFQAFGCAVSWAIVDNVSLLGSCLINWALALLCLPPLAYLALVIHSSAAPTDFDIDMEFSELRSEPELSKTPPDYSV
ncbi:hypothetical protein GQ54DRAFT_323968 [Martensiomyces pterosporus]|nr:hypothetical protein GQ54DRAFT_323968 [Martensiomyces pterosporus]